MRTTKRLSKNIFICISFISSILLAILLLINWAGNSESFVYPISLMTLFLVFYIQYKTYNQMLFLSFFAICYAMLVLILAMGVWKWGGDSYLFHINIHAFPYLQDGSVANAATVGCLSFLIGHAIVGYRNIRILKSANYDVIIDSKSHSNDTVKIAVFMLILVISWLAMLNTAYSIIWFEPHLTKSQHIIEGSLYFSYGAAWHALNNVVLAIILDYAIRSGVKIKLLIYYALILSAITFSFGNRGSGALVIVSIVVLLTLHRKVYLPYGTFIISAIVSGIIISFWGYLRYEAYHATLFMMMKKYSTNIIDSGGYTYVYDAIPLIGQNLAHYSGYIMLYESGISSTIQPYLAGILNFLPRAWSLNLGLPVDPSKTHASLLLTHFTHAGGSYLFGEPYWLGGIMMVVMLNIIFGALFLKIDLYFLKRRKEGKFIGHYVGSILLMIIGIAYGFSGWIRAFYMLVAVEAIIVFFEKPKQKNMPYAPVKRESDLKRI